MCKEHVLIIGPPGTAKSAVASAVLGRIVDEASSRPSLFSKQLAENTVQTDLIGPVDFKVLTETGRTEYLTDEGMLGAVHAFLDEVFDGRDMLLRSILNVLHERELKHGSKVTPGRCECAVMTSNRYLSEVIERSPETLQAFADRISFICFTPKSFARKTSRAQMLWRAQAGQRLMLSERLTLQQLDVLQDVVSAVDVPAHVAEGLETLADTLEKELLTQVVKLPDYVPTKYFSQRSLVKALWALRAVVVHDKMYRRPDRKLVAEFGDLERLRHFFLLGGPPPGEVDGLLKTAADPRERAQLEIIRVENKAFDDALARIAPLMAKAAEREAADLQLKDDSAATDALTRAWNPAIAQTVTRSLQDKLVPGPRHPENRLPLLHTAQQLLAALDARALKGMAGQGEGRGGVPLLSSMADVLAFVRRVPEFSSRVPVVAKNVADFCAQAAQMVSLTAEATEFDEQLKLENVAALAVTLGDELAKIAEVVQAVTAVLPAANEPLQGELGQARSRVGVALSRRASRTFKRSAEQAAPKKTDALETLSADSRRLRELEQALVELSPNHRGLREALLRPLAETYAREVVTGLSFAKLENLVAAVQALVDNLAREGASVNLALRSVHELIERRVRDFSKDLSVPSKVALPSAQVLSGEAYTVYRQQLVASAPEGSLLALQNLNLLLTERTGLSLAPQLRTGVENVEAAWLGSRVRFLRDWLTALLQALPPVAALKGRADADKVFDALVRSRFPMLVTREGEFVRLRSAVARLEGDWARTAEATVAQLAAEFGDYSRKLLDVRDGK